MNHPPTTTILPIYNLRMNKERFFLLKKKTKSVGFIVFLNMSEISCKFIFFPRFFLI